MFDSHCHLNFQAFNKDLDTVVRRFTEKGGVGIVVVGAKIDSSCEAIKISQHYPICHASVGIHPHHLDSVISFEKTGTELTKLAGEKKVVAIGETGLDYHHYNNHPSLTQKQKIKQQQLFQLHLTVAHELKLPLIIHCRQAQEDLLGILTDFLKNHCLTGVFHCFDGSKEYLETVLSLGFFVGFNGNITYKNNEHLRSLVRQTPLDKLLVETDSPYLTPEPFRDQRNEPVNLRLVIQKIAQEKKEPIEEIISVTTKNARSLFNSC